MIFKKEGYSFEYSINDGKIYIDKCLWDGANKVVFPSSINGIPVFRIGKECFKNDGYFYYNVEEIEIEEGIEEIGDYAFIDLSELKKIHIPSTVNKIGDFIFDGCTSYSESEIELIDINENNPVYSSCNNSNLILEKKKGILLYAFSSSNLEANQIKIIKSGAFRNLPNLKTLNISEGCIFIEQNAIENCENLETLIIPSTVENAYNAIKNCWMLSNVMISNSNKYIKYDETSKNFYSLNQTYTRMPLEQ